MRLKELRGLPVIDPTAARKIGSVVDYQVDPANGHVAAVDITSAINGETERILASRVRRVGRSAVILTARGGSLAGTPAEVDERWLDGSTLTGLEVMGEDGNRVGRLMDATFDQDSLSVQTYLLQVSSWGRLTGTRGQIQPSTVHACSRELMIVKSSRVTDAGQPPVASEPDAAEGRAAAESPTAVITRVPLKTEDRAPAPAFEQVSDGETVGTR